MKKEEIQKEKVNRVYKWLKGEEQDPVEVEIYPTYRCNLNCKYCSVPQIMVMRFQRRDFLK